jgi:hypothetical protein
VARLAGDKCHSESPDNGWSCTRCDLHTVHACVDRKKLVGIWIDSNVTLVTEIIADTFIQNLVREAILEKE